ncbi:MAG: GldG family protein [Gammaproteobacteria bacterium]|nr:GldG family protein [Gammaproteobacteria bacterium]
MNRQKQWALSLQSWLSVVLLLVMVGLLAWLGTRYHFEMDWTASGRHTLSESTQQLLKSLDEPVAITAFTRQQGEQGIRQRIAELVERYRQLKPDLMVEYVDPDQEPEQVRREGITLDGELLIHYQGRKEHLKTIGEQALTNALQRLARSGERRVYFLEGHGERSFEGQANHDLARWAERLKQKGFQFAGLNLSSELAVPEQSAVLVIASPQSELLSGEVQIINEYIAGGGNLLWLHDPKEPVIAITEELGLSFNEGTIVDPTGQALGIENPAIIVVPDYPEHSVTSGLASLTLFPLAHAIGIAESSWQAIPFLQSLERSWSEHQPLQGMIQFDEESDQQGPLNIGVLLERTVESGDQSGTETASTSQRIAVIGDGDFISNAYLGNGANQELGDRLLNWLSFDDELISIPPKVAPDINLQLTPNLAILFGFGFLILIPGLLLGSGVWIWLRRRQR